MSGSTPNKNIPEINLDEFERRLRAGGAAPGPEDPLAELTRLVNMISRDTAKGGEAAPPRAPKAEAIADVAPPPELEIAETYDEAPEPLELSQDERAALLASAAEMGAQRAGGRRNWYYKTVGLAAVGVVLLGGAAAMKIGVVPGIPKKPPFIAAAEGPTKIQPPSDATVQSAGDAGALLMKDSATSAPVKIVSSEEQPVDLRAQTLPTSPSPSPAASAGSPVPPTADTPIVPPSEPSATVAPLFPVAKPVKTVSVRPDGTLISSDSASAAPSAPPPAKTAARVADAAPSPVAPEPATPKVDLPTKLSPKSAARVVAKTDTTAPASATETTPNAPLQLGVAPRPSKPAKTPPPAAEAAATDAPAASEPASGGGDWAVQFAAPRSEADAQSAISRLKSKYSDALAGADIGVRKADVKGETIYRVRASGLSKADAAALCAKLKASGGDCFIARN